MKAFLLWDLLSPILLIAIIVHNVPQSEALTPLETCQVVKNGTFIGDPSDCQGWYYCLNGAPIAGKCKTGLLFNSYTGSCDYSANVVCAANVTTMCKGLNAVFKRDPTSCQGYCYCTNGVTECASCPTGQVFDLGSSSCVWADDTLCESDSPCLLVPNSFIKNPNSCAGWYYCVNGEIVKDGNCGTGLYYDAFNAICNYEDKVECNVVTTAPATTTPKIPTSYTPAICTAASKGFLSDGATCRGYFYCKVTTIQDNDGNYVDSVEYHWAQCPEGSQFYPATQNCTNPYNVDPVCGFDRCEGMSVGYMAVKGCLKYVICTNGVSSTTQYECPTAYKFFNENLQACVEKEPELAICKPTS